ncbi:MAG TPA: SDR family oxidoreductase [Streptosporangiaceae bacterium]|nr:SDR family oxidoreductase [Streptosporangiaceae bacterium]
MTRRFEGKTALITGGGTGIGAATARRLAAEGARVTLAGRRKEPLDEVAGDLGAAAHVVTGDAAATEDADEMVNATVERFGRLDVLVANAGGHGFGKAGQTSDEDWRQAITSNLDTAFRAARAALPHLERTRGSIVFVSSIAGLFAGPEVAGYVTTKHALIGLTRSVARDYGHLGIRANAVCPGWVRTPMADGEMEVLCQRHGITIDEAYELVTKDTALRRPAQPDEIASVIAFIASPDAAVMTGTILVADSGASCVDLPTLAFAEN